MDKEKTQNKKLKLDKNIIIASTVCTLIFGLLGFYGGRYYERNTFRQNFAQNRQNFRMRMTPGVTPKFNRDQNGNRMMYQNQ